MNYHIDQQELIENFSRTRTLSESICKPLKTEDHVPQPITDVSPPKWHLAHTTWFFEQFVLQVSKPGYECFHDDFSFLFNSYYNNVGERTIRSQRGFVTRPTVEEVYEYRNYVTEHMMALLSETMSQEALSVIEIGINHEQQHQELLVYDIKYILGSQPLKPVYGPQYDLETQNEEMNWVRKTEGLYEIGSRGEGFSFDNEFGRHQVYLHDYEICDRLVTNAEYLEFVESGAYQDHDLWLSEGWDLIQQEHHRAPEYWEHSEKGWKYYTMGGVRPLDLNKPVSHISYFEASAFAEWAGYRLPTEYEWEAAANEFKWGDLWEWTSSAYQAYPGYSKVPGALGEYNGKFMINQQVLRGASVATPAGHSRSTYRNFFNASSRWILSGIRLARKAE